ncbi:TonB-dependent siderophore receptor [Pusillimonas caeni]|uniref:TonB-dependent siderophore receptor n=1 Tax=Pusillimonas caeni TaxID=1348472 RepID=UPI00142F61C8|nr:TonB-dependent receptor [Pusillimonas caeni]
MIDETSIAARKARSERNASPRLLAALSGLAVAASLALTAASLPAHAQETAAQINIPQQSLSDALLQLGQQTSLQFIYTSDLVRDMPAPTVIGRMAPEEALRRLLSGTGIEYSREGNTIHLRRTADAAKLETITVTGGLLATTEDSGSYAPQAATIGKSAQSLREIPQSVSVMTRSQMDDQGFTRVAEALDFTTGIRSSGYPDTESFNSRGFAASLQYDGVPAQETGAPHLDLAIYDRIEVLRGPAGLLTGTGEPGGAINLVRKRPTDEFRFVGALSGGSWNNRRLEADVSGPITADGRLRGRLVGAYQDKDQFYEQGMNNPQILYGVLEYDLGPNTTVGVSALYSKLRFRNFNGLPQFDDGALPDYDAFLGPNRTSVHDIYELGADLTHRFDNGWVFKANYSHKESTYKGFSAFALAPLSASTGRADLWGGRIFNEFVWDQADVNLTGPFRLLGREHFFTLGYNVARNNTHTSSRFSGFPNWDALNDFDYGAALDEPILNRGQDITIQSGLYASARLKLHDSLTAVLGGRWSNYETKSRSVDPASTPWEVSAAKVRGEFTPFAGLVFDVNKQISVYGSYAETFVPQADRDYTGAILDPRKGWQVEAGVKGEFLDGRLNGSLAVYRLRDTNRAVIDPEHIGCGDSPTGTCYRAAGLIQSQGWEFEVVGNPMAGWDIGAGYTYTDARVLRDNATENEGGRFNANLIPKHLFRLWTQYRFGGGDWNGRLRGWSVGAGVQAQSNLLTQDVYQGGYTTVSAKIGYKPNKNWEAMLVVNNLFDRRYLDSVGYSTFLNIYGAPRNALLTVKYRY